jgi:hypothetical protein
MLIAHATKDGEARTDVNVGDRFKWWDGSEWEIVEFTGQGMYSPSGIGGTPTLKCRPLSEISEHFRKYAEPDGTVDWCGDSVAGALSRS